MIGNEQETEEGAAGFILSRAGLEVALDEAAKNLVAATRAENSSDAITDSASIDRLRRASSDTVKLLDLILWRNDGTTWSEEVEERAKQTDS